MAWEARVSQGDRVEQIEKIDERLKDFDGFPIHFHAIPIGVPFLLE